MAEIIILVAVARNGVIGREGKLPWHLPSDLQHFKNTTMGHPMIMGRKTFDSIGKALPGRENIVLTRNRSLIIPDCVIMHSLESALHYCRTNDKVFIIGGEAVFKAALPVTDTIILTALDRDIPGDVFFPPVDPTQFSPVSRQRYNYEEPYEIIYYHRLS